MTKRDPTRRRAVFVQCLVLFAIAASLRVAWIGYRYAGSAESAGLSYPDEEVYVALAKSLSAGRGLVDPLGFRAGYMPLYPAFLSLFQDMPSPLFWSRIFQALLGATVAPATFYLASRWMSLKQDPTASVSGHIARVPLIAGLFSAFDPFLIFFSGLLLTETLFVPVLVAAWAVCGLIGQTGEKIRWQRGVVAGALLALCVLLRPSSVILLFLIPPALMLDSGLDARRLAHACIAYGVVLAALLPWAIRNQQVLGQMRWLTTRGGISLYDGLQPGSDGASDLAHTKSLPEIEDVGELEWDVYFRSQAIAEARSDPVRVVRLAGRKILRTWSLTPNVQEYRGGSTAAISACWMIVALVTAAIGLLRKRGSWKSILILLLPVIGITLLHAVFVGSVRYRVPMMPFIYVLSAIGMVSILERLPAGSSRTKR